MRNTPPDLKMKKKTKMPDMVFRGPVTIGQWPISLELFCPRKAQECLDGQIRNRNLRKAHWTDIAGDMENGYWLLTPAPLIFDANGSLLDGQHRLTGVVVSGCPQFFYVFRGVPEHVFHLLDQGCRRSNRDIYSLHKDDGDSKYGSQCCGVARAVLLGVDFPKKDKAFSAPRDLAFAEFSQWHHELIMDYIKLFHTPDFRRCFSSSWVGGFVVAALLYGRDEIDPMAERLGSMTWTGHRDPMKALYRYIQARGGAQLLSSGQPLKWSRRAYRGVVMAIKADRRGTGLKQIRAPRTQESFDFKGVVALRQDLIAALAEWYNAYHKTFLGPK